MRCSTASRAVAVRFVVGSAMMIASEPLWDVLDRSALTIVDDVNAFDEREHLRLLEDLDCPLLFASATPNELQRFLERVGAFNNVVTMRAMPFDVLPTKVHKITAYGVNRRPNSSGTRTLYRVTISNVNRAFS